ncbi:MAG: response regulator [Candidatus Fibromonas sp.]|jgi:two-component system chemotaxis response regulator CheY|nr:response regulator [Candidatus Fibromonas sp.]
MKILLVDDSSTMRRIQKNTLASLGYTEVVEAEDGADALEKLRQNPDVQLTLMDWNMPNMTGIEALKAIKSNPATKAIPVMMVTSEAEKAKIVEAIQNGASNYLVKPFEAAALKEKITGIVGA